MVPTGTRPMPEHWRCTPTMRTTILHQAPDLVHVAWHGAWTRNDYRSAVLQAGGLLEAQGATRLLLDLHGLCESETAPPDKYFLGCLLVAHLTEVRCAVLLPKEYITGLLTRVGAEAGVQLRTFWNEGSARQWLESARVAAPA